MQRCTCESEEKGNCHDEKTDGSAMRASGLKSYPAQCSTLTIKPVFPSPPVTRGIIKVIVADFKGTQKTEEKAHTCRKPLRDAVFYRQVGG